MANNKLWYMISVTIFLCGSAFRHHLPTSIHLFLSVFFSPVLHNFYFFVRVALYSNPLAADAEVNVPVTFAHFSFLFLFFSFLSLCSLLLWIKQIMQTAQEVESLVCFFSLHSRAGFNFIFHRNVAFYERNRKGGGEKKQRDEPQRKRANDKKRL